MTDAEPVETVAELAERTRRIVVYYKGQGVAPIPVPFMTKKPIIDGWQTLEITEENAANYFPPDQRMNIGGRMGAASGGLTDIDLDSREAIILAPYFLPATLMFGREGKPRSHWLYQTTLHATMSNAVLAFNDIAEIGADGKKREPRIAEIRCGGGDKGCQTVLPGSVHESGELIGFENHDRKKGLFEQITIIDGLELEG